MLATYIKSSKETLELFTARKGESLLSFSILLICMQADGLLPNLMAIPTECAAALLSFRYPSLLIKDFLNALTASVQDFFYFNSVKFTYIDDMILIFLY